MGATDVWLGNQAWPSNQSLTDFAKDVFRLSGAKTDKEKALAFYDWMIRCMMRGPNLSMPDGSGAYARHLDPLTVFSSWGHGECTFWGWIPDEALNGAGLKSRRVVVHNSGHTFYEVWYEGDDGEAAWHAFDPFCSWYFLNEKGEVASCEELAKNPQLAQNPLPGHALPLGHHPDRSGLEHRHRCEDLLVIQQIHRFEELHWQLHKGQEVTINWMPEAPAQALFTRYPSKGELPVDTYPNGAHCGITEINRLGEVSHPKHEPYWKNYRWPTPCKTNLNEGRPVRWHGSGALRWKPLLYGAQVTEHAVQAKFENGDLMPTEAHHFTEVWYHFKLPFLTNYIALSYDFAGSGGDYLGFAISGDERRSVWPLKMKNRPGWATVKNGQAEWKAGEHSIQGMKEFWLRIDMFTHADANKCRLRALDLVVGFQHNMHVQPRLLPGENPLWLEAKELSKDCSLEAEWIYQGPDGQSKTQLELKKSGKTQKKVNISEKKPEDIRMTGLRLRCK